MNIGILSKKETGLVEKIKSNLESKQKKVNIYTSKNLFLNGSLLNNDFFILKSKKKLFLYAAYYIESHKIPVFPNPTLCYHCRHRILADSLAKNAGLKRPNIFFGTLGMLKKQLEPHMFPFILKSVMSSGGLGIKIIDSIEDLDKTEDIIYLEKIIEGKHYSIHFIEDDIMLFEKTPFSQGIKKSIPPTEDFIELISNWRKFFKEGLFFGHLDVVRENNTDELYVVDIGTFPQFKNWENGIDPAARIANIIIEQIKSKKKNSILF